MSNGDDFDSPEFDDWIRKRVIRRAAEDLDMPVDSSEREVIARMAAMDHEPLPAMQRSVSVRYLQPRDQVRFPLRDRGPYADLQVALAEATADPVKISLDQLPPVSDWLPNEALTSSGWWTDPTSGQSIAWRQLGYQVVQADLKRRIVTFRRNEAARIARDNCSPGFAPHWIQVKQASQAVESWYPGRVESLVGDCARVRLSDTELVLFCVWVHSSDLTVGDLVWMNAGFRILNRPTGDESKVFSVVVLDGRRTSGATDLEELWPGRRPPGFGLTAIAFSELPEDEKADALRLVGEDLKRELAEGGTADLSNSVWLVGEYRFGGKGDRWVNSFEVQDWLEENAEDLLSMHGEGHFIHVDERLYLVEFAKDLVFVAYGPTDEDGWRFVEVVDRSNVQRITELALDAFRFGRSGDAIPDHPWDSYSVYEPLDERVFEEDQQRRRRRSNDL